jgi:hypothetical protein
MLRVILPVLSGLVLFYQSSLYAKSDNNFNDMDHVENYIAEVQKQRRLYYEFAFINTRRGCDWCSQRERPNGEPSYNWMYTGNLREHR